MTNIIQSTTVVKTVHHGSELEFTLSDIPELNPDPTPATLEEKTRAFCISVNPHFVGKVAKDAPDQVWGAFNNSFEHRQATLDELAAHITQGHAITALTRGKRKTENFIARQDLGADFDTEDQRSAIETLQTHPFIAQYGAILHTTASHRPTAPRARALFILDQPIKDPDQYREYAQALNWYFNTTDAQCYDPARVWFGAPGCDLYMPGNVLPVAVMDELVTQWKEAQPAPAPTTPTPAVDAHELLDQALREGRAGNRNNTGFWLARQLRDAGYLIDQAREILLDYQQAVERIGNHPYLVREATDSLASAYNHKPRVDVSLDTIENAVIAGTIHVSANVQKTLFGLTSLARKTGKTEIAASLREIEKACFGFVDKTSIARHISDLIEAGLLEVTCKSNHRKGTVYKLLIPAKVGHSQQEAPPTALTVPLLPVCAQHYSVLQADPICGINAQIHPLMARNDDELHHSFGSSVQRILACLRTLPDGVDSLETLQEATHLSARTVSNKVNYLAAHGIVETLKEGTRRRVKLAKYSPENIGAITPALTTYGQDILRGMRSAKQQIAHHAHMAKYTNDPEKKELSEATIDRADNTLNLLKEHKAEAYRMRQQWMQDNGLETPAPALSLHPRSNPKAREKVTHVNGHDLTPGDKAVSKPNGLSKLEHESLAGNIQMLKATGTRTREIYRQLILAGYTPADVSDVLYNGGTL